MSINPLTRLSSLPGPIDGLMCAVVRPADQQTSEGVHRVGRCYRELMANGADVIGLDSKVGYLVSC